MEISKENIFRELHFSHAAKSDSLYEKLILNLKLNKNELPVTNIVIILNIFPYIPKVQNGII